MRVLGLITARGGSKGLPGKNVRSFYGHPLLAWTVRQSVLSKSINKTLISTDDESMATMAQRYGAEAPFLRPVELANDTATSLDVAIHALDFLAKERDHYDVVVLLQPTSPLRMPGDLDGMVALLQKNWNECDAVIAVAPCKPSPRLALEEEGGFLRRLVSFNSSPRQQQAHFYASYGLGWAIKTETLKSEKTFYPSRSLAFKTHREQAVDIDDLWDFVTAEAHFQLLANQGINLAQAYMKGHG